jgi:hypothetical protein
MSKFNREPRRAKSDAQLKEIVARYIRMGFSPREARFKANQHHSMKL